MTPTPCETCDHVVTATRSKAPHHWMCVRFPRVEGLDPVAPTQRVVMEPYNRCLSINLGHCPCWAPRREGQTAMRLEE
jgi:hypothetical protein